MTMTECLSRVGKILIIAGVVVLSITYVHSLHSSPISQTSSAQAELPQSPAQSEFEDLLDAIEWVESSGDPNAVGDNGNAIGAYQIWKIYVRDANRILGWDKYTYEDRWDRDKSREMTAIVIQHYGKGDIETMARTHKCPPERYKESTKAYWVKIKARLPK